MTAVVFTAGQIVSASSLNAVAQAADEASTAAAGMADSATAAALSAQHALDQATLATAAAANTTSFATASGVNAANSATSMVAAQAAATTAGAAAASASGFNVGRNKLHNPYFNIQQHPSGPWTAAGYSRDRWLIQSVHSTGTLSVSGVALLDADRAQIGDETALFSISYTFNGGAGAGDYDILSQRMETVNRFSAKTVTVSFWAKAASGAPKVGVELIQVFGSGGTPSLPVTPAGSSVTLSTAWVRYSITLSLPSVAGKTLGTTLNSEYTDCQLWLSGGSSLSARSGNIGVQAGTVSFWGMQLEFGSVMTPLEYIEPKDDLERCQRFYQVGSWEIGGYSTNGITNIYNMIYSVQMRQVPTLGYTAPTLINVSAASPTNLTPSQMSIVAIAGALGGYLAAGAYTLNADL